jgi:hypothetical protein
MPTENDLQSSYDGVTGWLRGLMDVLGTGFRSTADAFQTDVDALRAGQFPPQALKAGEQVIAAAGQPGVIPTIATAPLIKWVPSKNPVLAKAGVEDALVKAYPGGNPLESYLRSGTANPILEEMFNMWQQAQKWNTPPAPSVK